MSKKCLIELSDLSWVEAKKIAETIKTAILPIGSTEQHGLHLPIGTDSYILKGLLEALKAELGNDYPVLFLPMIPVGKSVEHLDFFGTLSFSWKTLGSMVDDICYCLHHHGFEKVVFLDTHGGNLDLLKAISFDIRQKYDLYTFTLHAGAGKGWSDPEFWKEVFPEMTDEDWHAGSLETSLIALLRPELVGNTYPSPKKRQPLEFPFGWKTNDISEIGVIGDPQYYSVEAGEKAMRREVSYLHKILDEIIKY